mgnify:CR=1 FL=1
MLKINITLKEAAKNGKMTDSQLAEITTVLDDLASKKLDFITEEDIE